MEMKAPHLKRLGYFLLGSMTLHFLVLIAVCGGLGGRSGPFSVPGVIFVELISLGSKGAEASMATEPTPFAQATPEAQTRPEQQPLPALDREQAKGEEPVKSRKTGEANRVSGQQKAGLRQGEPLAPEPGLPFVDEDESASRAGARRPRENEESADLVNPPQCASCPAPPYPAQAQERGIEGEVVLKLEVLSDGRVGDIFVVTSSGFPLLDDAALAVVKNWTFYPATQEGHPISSTRQVRVPFEMSGP